MPPILPDDSMWEKIIMPPRSKERPSDRDDGGCAVAADPVFSMVEALRKAGWSRLDEDWCDQKTNGGTGETRPLLVFKDWKAMVGTRWTTFYRLGDYGSKDQHILWIDSIKTNPDSRQFRQMLVRVRDSRDDDRATTELRPTCRKDGDDDSLPTAVEV